MIRAKSSTSPGSEQEFGDEGLPPGQSLREDFPVLSKSDTPRVDTDDWEFTVSGAVEYDPTWEQFIDLPSETQLQDFHCVTGWSRFDNKFTGVPFPEIVKRAGVTDDAVHVLFGAADDYTTDLAFEACNRQEVLFASELDGEPLPADHGGPLRVVTPQVRLEGREVGRQRHLLHQTGTGLLGTAWLLRHRQSLGPGSLQLSKVPGTYGRTTISQNARDSTTVEIEGRQISLSKSSSA